MDRGVSTVCSTDTDSSVTHLRFVACPLCGSADSETVYERRQKARGLYGSGPVINVLCQSCGFMYVNPRPSSTALREYYRGNASASGNSFHSSEPWGRHARLTDERRRFIRGMIDAYGPAHGSMVDAGCGEGDLLEKFDLPGWACQGIEVAPLAAAKARLKGVLVECGDIEQVLAETVETFDVIACISTFEHLYDIRRVARAFWTALQPGGLLFLEVPDSTRPLAQIAEFFTFEHLSHFTRGTLTRLLNVEGFTVQAFDQDVGLPNLRVCAKKEAPVRQQYQNDSQALRRAISNYKRQREAIEEEVRHRLSTLITGWKAEGKRVAVYGAGMHTRFLLEVVDLVDVVAVFDSDSTRHGRRFLEWTIASPDSVAVIQPDVVIISSRDSEEEIYESIAFWRHHHGIEIVRIYTSDDPSED